MKGRGPMETSKKDLVWNIVLAVLGGLCVVSGIGSLVAHRSAQDAARRVKVELRELISCGKAATDPSLLEIIQKQREQGMQPALGTPEAIMGFIESKVRNLKLPKSVISKMTPTQQSVTKTVNEFLITVDMKGLKRRQIVDILYVIQSELPDFIIKKVKMVVSKPQGKGKKAFQDTWDLTFTLSRYFRSAT